MMKKIPLILVYLCLMTSPVFAFSSAIQAVIGASSAPSGFCAGTELFCATFEADGEITWTATPGDEDCDGYDADNDWCDYDATAPNPLVGVHGGGIRGANTVYVSKTLTSTTKEFHTEFTWRTDAANTFHGFRLYDDTASKYTFSVYVMSSGVLSIYFDNGNSSLTDDTISANTTYHIGVYFKEATNSTSLDGKITIWLNTDGSAFNAADIIHGPLTNLDCNNGLTTRTIMLQGPVANKINYYDNVKVITGTPPASWSE